MRKLRTKFVGLVLALSVCLGSKGMVALAQENVVAQSVEQNTVAYENVEKSEILQENVDDYFDNKLTIFEGENFQVINCLTDSWDGGFNASFVVNNTGDMDIRNWYIRFPAQFDIANIWNAEIEKEEDGAYLVKNVGWNSVIEAGGCVQFGITVYENFTEFPNDYEIMGTNVKMSEDTYEIVYEIYDVWDAGFAGSITINNKSTEVIEDWKLEFEFENEFTDLWNAEILSREGNHYMLQNAGYNSNIGAGESVSIGFVVGSGNAKETLSNVFLSAFSLDAPVKNEAVGTQEEQDKSYIKEATEEDIVFDEEEGISYVNNQIIVSTHLGASKDLMKSLVEELGADIVGYIELTEDYQLEFRQDMTYTELMEKIAYVKEFPFVRYAEVNFATPCETQYFSNDALYVTEDLWKTSSYDTNGDGKYDDKEKVTTTLKGQNDGWNTYLVGGNNWGLEALGVHRAWDYKESFKETVRVGIYDSMFGENEDLKYGDVYGNPSTIEKVHGTHVAGIIGATHNNGRGISGVATDVSLYCYAEEGNSATFYFCLERLIKKNVRVINVSYGYLAGISYGATVAATTGKENKSYKYVMREANALSDKLQRLIERGYDFLIVNSAGNGNGGVYVEDPNEKEDERWDYVVYNSKEKSHVGLTQYIGYPDAKYNFHTTAIEEKAVKSRIMVVGSVGHTKDGYNTKYWVAGSSQEGDRVDVYAPGVQILSTVPEEEFSEGYMTKSGTSMAAPHITGLAALMWQANPDLTAAQVKMIIKESKGYQIGNTGKYMPDAEECVLAALNAIN